MYMYISLHILHDTLSITTCTITAGKYKCTLFAYILLLYIHISLHILHDTLSITTCTTTGGKYSVFMYIVCTCTLILHVLLLYMYACTSLHDTLSITTCTTTEGKYSVYIYIYVHVYLSSHSPWHFFHRSLPEKLHRVSTLFSCTFTSIVHVQYGSRRT